jgi:hypothetical protein
VSLLWAKRGWLTPGSQTLRTLERFGATDAWDFVDNSYMRAGVVTTNAGLTVTRASEGYAQREDGIWVNFASGALRRTDRGLLVEGARTNRALHSRDLTQAAWTATNITVARNQVGIDGLANTACSLTATAGNGTVLQAVTDASKARYFSVWIKRITGTGTVEVTLDNGSTWTAVTVTSAYTRVGATQTLANPTVGVRLVTDTDAVAVDFAQLEDGAFPTSPIVTAGSSATRAADEVTAAQTTAYSASIYGEFSQDVLTGSVNNRIFQIDGGSVSNRSSLYLNTNQVTYRVSTSGSNVATMAVSGAISPGVVYKTAGRTKLDDVRVYRNGTQGTQDTSAALPATATTARFGVGVTTGEELDGYLRRAAVIPLALTDAQLQAITT